LIGLLIGSLAEREINKERKWVKEERNRQKHERRKRGKG
jgi:hypothetical protein